MNHHAIILAAGKGTRMKSNLYKVLHPVLGKPMISYVIDNLEKLNIKNKIVIIPEEGNDLQNQLPNDIKYAVQSEQLGTGHAVMMAEHQIGKEEGTTLVICGDTPLITSETLKQLLNQHEKLNSDITILTTIMDNPENYGHIIRDKDNEVLKIVEHKDADSETKKIKEINTGTYCFNNKKLFEALKKIKNDNKQKEYYLTDVIGIIKQENGKVNAYITEDNDETLGINDRVALEKANQILKLRINENLMRNGVTIIDKENTYISSDTEVGQDTIIYPGTICFGKNKIGNHCIIGPNTKLTNVEIGNDTKVENSVITDSQVGSNTTVGPFAHLRNQAIVGDQVRIGNFVEIKKSEFGHNSNAAHLSYIGDAEVGSNVNMGCGTITVNYDGKTKHKTIIGDNSFVGCNSNLIAPISIGKNSYIAAGSTINKNVPNDALAIARNRQENKEGYAKKYRK